MNPSGWDTFWENQGKSFDTVMDIATSFFAHQLIKSIELKKDSKILDYGCGPGFLADQLARIHLSITGLDINSQYLDRCREKHPSGRFLQITTSPHRNLEILENELKDERFNLIILLSITQYFKNSEELEHVIRILLPHTAPHGKIILADIVDSNTSNIRDALGLLYHCTRKRKIISYIRFILHLLFSNYRKLSRNVKLLTVSSNTVAEIASNNKMRVEKISGLTIHASRSNYILTKTE